MQDRPSSSGSLFWKYFQVLFAAAVLPLLAGGGIESWLGYRDRRALLDGLLQAEARLAAARIDHFLEEVAQQLSWTVQLPWTASADETRQTDASRLLRQAPGVLSVGLVDGEGRERLFVSRLSLNRRESRVDRSTEAPVVGAKAAGANAAGASSSGAWFGPVTLYRASEPHMIIAVAGPRPINGVAVGQINLKLIWDVITAIQVGGSGQAFVMDQAGTLVAHPDLSLALRGPDDPAAGALGRLRDAVRTRGGPTTGRDAGGRDVLAAIAPVPASGWTVVVHQPVAEAFGPLYAALGRTVVLLAAGAALAAALAYWLARRIARPIQRLEDGARRIGAGQFGHRIAVGGADELARLAMQFNRMAGELALSLQRSERIDRLKRFLAPQVAELVDEAGDAAILDSRRADIVAVFCDLRGFTAFSAGVEPETVMDVLGAYYDAVEEVVAAFGATLTSRSGDGMMMLVNAPVPCPDPALRAVEMAVALQATVQGLVAGWRGRGHGLGFGVGLATGSAAVGRIGSQSRLDYTAIGSVVNLASRLCSSAADRQILVDPAVAEAVQGRIALVSLGAKPLRGFSEPVTVFGIEFDRPAPESR